jgi:uncharacterized membrane protein
MNILLKSIIILPIVDFIYFRLISSHFKQQIFDVQKSEMKLRLIPAIICYIALLALLNYFVLNTNDPVNKKVLNAFILGLCVYAVYETTNYALIDNWSVKTVIIDTLWGGVLFALTTYLVNLKF